jgi:hypothetical protein
VPEVNWVAVVVAAVSAFVIGGVWYSPLLFARTWQREAGVTDDQIKQASMGMIFGGAFVLTLIAAAMFAVFLGPSPGWRLGIGAGASAGICWVAASFGVNYLFERRSFKLFLINGGYNAVVFTVIGAVLGALG